MRKEIKENRNKVLQKEHFEILLEDIQSSVKAIAEGHSVLNNNINAVSRELHETKEELIFLIKASNESSEQRLTKKIKEGEDSVRKDLTIKIEDVKKTLMQHTDQKIDEVKEILKAHADKFDDHEERISRIEQKG